MLKISADPLVPLDLKGVQHLALTSANGVRAFAERSDRRDLTAWCVGPATREAALHAGFADIREGEGNADDLAKLMLSETPKLTGRVLHVANAAAAGNLLRALTQAGVEAAFAPLYHAEPVKELSQAAQRFIASGARGYVLIHSARGAEAFRAGLAKTDASGLIAVAVSAKAGAPLEGAGLRAIVHAAQPNEDGLFTALDAAVLAFR